MSSDIRRNVLLIESFAAVVPTTAQQVVIIETLIWSGMLNEGPVASIASAIARRVQSLRDRSYSLPAAQQVYSNAVAQLNGADPQTKSTASRLIRTSGRNLGTVGGLLTAAMVIASLMSASPAQAQDENMATMKQVIAQSINDLNGLKAASGQQTASSQQSTSTTTPTAFAPQFDATSLQTLGGKEDFQWNYYGHEMSREIYSVNSYLKDIQTKPEFSGYQPPPIPQPPTFRSNTDVSTYTNTLKQWKQTVFQYGQDHDTARAEAGQIEQQNKQNYDKMIGAGRAAFGGGR